MMMKTVLAGVLILGTVSLADAMPTAPLSSSVSAPIVEAAVVVKKVIRRAPVRHRTVVKKTVIRR